MTIKPVPPGRRRRNTPITRRSERVELKLLLAEEDLSEEDARGGSAAIGDVIGTLVPKLF